MNEFFAMTENVSHVNYDFGRNAQGTRAQGYLQNLGMAAIALTIAPVAITVELPRSITGYPGSTDLGGGHYDCQSRT